MNFEVLVDLPPAATFTRYVCVYQKSTIKSTDGVRICSLSSSFGIRNPIALRVVPKVFGLKQKLPLCFSYILFSLCHHTDK